MACESKGISKEIIEELKKRMPNIFFRKDVDHVLYGIFTRGTLAILEYQRVGPPIYYVGKRVAYMKKTFIPWLEKYYNFQQINKDIENEDIDETIHRDKKCKNGVTKIRRTTKKS